MKMIPIKVLLAEAVTPDGAVHGESVTVSPTSPGEVLDFMEESLMTLLRRRYPGAAEYQSWGWKDAEVAVPEDE